MLEITIIDIIGAWMNWELFYYTKNAFPTMVKNRYLEKELATPRGDVGRVFLNGDGEILEVNDAFLEMLGYKATELQGIPASNLVSKKDKKSILSMFYQVGYNYPKNFYLETTIVTREGKEMLIVIKPMIISKKGDEIIKEIHVYKI